MTGSYLSEFGGERSSMLLLFIFLSFVVHALLLITFYSPLDVSKNKYIELDLHHNYEKEVYQIPQQPKLDQVRTRLSEALKIQPELFEQPKIITSESDLSTRKINLPDIAKFEKTKISDYTPSVANKTRSKKQDQEIRRQYLHSIRQKIDSHKSYPDSAKRDGSQGKIKVSFTLLRDGSVKNVKSLTKMDPLLQKASENAVRKAAPFPPFPDSMRLTSINLTITLNFKLTKR